jgi:hypothetical protein
LPKSTSTIIESQPDWLTGACTGAERSAALTDLAVRLATEEEGAGNKITRWSVQSYQGRRCGRVGLGEAEGDRTIIQLSGDLAAQHLTEALPLLDRVTRIDLAVTVRTAEPDPHVAANAYELASLWWDEHPRSAAPWSIRHKQKGDTTYVGSRESDKFLRIYDKMAECKGHHDARNAERYENCWRYEIECKGHPAGLIALTADRALDQTAYVRGVMNHYLHTHGIEPIYTDASPCIPLPGFTRRTDAESRLFNLGRNVRPSLDWLRDAGYAEEALAILGLGINPYYPLGEKPLQRPPTGATLDP